MIELLWIIVWICAGLAVRHLASADRVGTLVRGINRFIMWIALPATILHAIHRMQWDPSYWIPISMAWIVFGFGSLLFVVVGRLYNWSPKTIGALILTAGLGNTSFMGFPLLRALYGEHAITIGILNDQPGSFLVLSTLGIFSASYFSARQPSLRSLFGRMFKFPLVWAMILALALRPIAFPEYIDHILEFGIKLLIPLALISVGAQLNFGRQQFERDLRPLIYGLAYKLILAPLLMAIFLVGVLHRNGEMIRVTVIEAAMGPMITGAILAVEYELDPPLCSLIVSLGIPVCVITVPIWAKILQCLGI